MSKVKCPEDGHQMHFLGIDYSKNKMSRDEEHGCLTCGIVYIIGTSALDGRETRKGSRALTEAEREKIEKCRKK